MKRMLMKKGYTVEKPEWWKHLRKFGKRLFWSRQRKANKNIIKKERKNAC